MLELLLGGLVLVGGGGRGGRSLEKMDLRPSMLESSARGVARGLGMASWVREWSQP